MKDTNLKKEFKQKEVQRMRNLITGKSGDRTQIQTGYEKSLKDRKEGETWEEGGKTWTIKNGIKQNLTKFDKFKKIGILPLLCPKCQKPMKVNEFNKKMYSIHSMCFDCVIEYEQSLKREGKFEEYSKNITESNKKVYLEDFEEALESWYNEKNTHVSENGEIESWMGGNKKEIYEQVREYLHKIKSEQT